MSDYRPVAERLRDWNEVNKKNIDYNEAAQQGAACLDCGVPFCQGNSGCPVDNLIPEWNKLANQNRWEEAFHRLHLTNNFPEFTGSLCPAPCESACVKGIHSDPVPIKTIEWSIIDRGFKEGWVQPQVSTVSSGRKVAIVGSGPAGLAAAQQLARQGHSVTVFEKNMQFGGLLRYGIPDFKFEKWRIDRRLEQMRAEGVQFRSSITIGKDITFDELKTNFDVIGLAIGAERARDLNIPGRNLKGVHLAMDYLTAQNKYNAGEISELTISAAGKNVVILGGGDTGSDCLGTALRQGAKSVTQIEIQQKPPLTRSKDTPWPMWSQQLRTSHAHEEGGERLWGLLTTRLEGHEGNVSKLIAHPAYFENGRYEIDNVGQEKSFDTELVILALGFQGSETSLVDKQLKITSSNGRLKSDPADGVFAAGDVCRGASLIVWAIADGRKMAKRIDSYLLNKTETILKL